MGEVLSNQKVWCAYLNTGNIATQESCISVIQKPFSTKQKVFLTGNIALDAMEHVSQLINEQK